MNFRSLAGLPVLRLLPLALGMLTLSHAHAATPVTGTITGQTWTAANSPYIVTGDITAANLTIQPGVSVLFSGNYAFTVAGRLTALGRSDARITFAPQAQGGSWKGLKFEFAGKDSELAWCTITGSSQGGVRIRSSKPAFYDCQITGNSLSGSEIGGAGIWTDSPLTLKGCTISNNALLGAVGGTGGTAAGAGIFSTASLVLERCVLSGNSARFSGNGLGLLVTLGTAICSRDSLTLNNCLIHHNEAIAAVPFGGRGLATGGGVFCEGTLAATNCVISDNYLQGSSEAYGGGIYLVDGTLIHCTVSGNRAVAPTTEAGGIATTAHPANPVMIANSIVWDNSPAEMEGEFSVSYSDVMGGAPGTGNINRNPLFESGGYFVVEGSPCIDAGNPAPEFNDRCFSTGLSRGGTRGDIGAGGGPGACGFGPDAAPRITGHPESRTICLGQSASFTVAATGNGPLRYQWLFNDFPMPGQTNATLTLTNVQAASTGSYRAIVSNPSGSATSAPAVLIFSDPCLEIAMYAGVEVNGVRGGTYIVSYTTNPGDNAIWTPIATNTLTTAEWFYIYRESSAAEKRFYRAERKP